MHAKLFEFSNLKCLIFNLKLLSHQEQAHLFQQNATLSKNPT